MCLQITAFVGGLLPSNEILVNKIMSKVFKKPCMHLCETTSDHCFWAQTFLNWIDAVNESIRIVTRTCLLHTIIFIISVTRRLALQNPVDLLTSTVDFCCNCFSVWAGCSSRVSSLLFNELDCLRKHDTPLSVVTFDKYIFTVHHSRKVSVYLW